MIIALCILLFLLILVALLLFCDFLVILSVSEKQLTLKVRVLHITIRIPLKKAEDKTEKKPKEINETQDSVMKSFLEMRNTFTRIRTALEKTLSYLCRKIHIKEMGVVGKFGLGNAALTGMSYGAVEAFAGLVTGFLQHFFKFEKPIYRNVQMEYDSLIFQLNFAMVLKTKPIYLLKAALIFLKHNRKH
ncbi:MAG: DUF2953 domain-containing protein [Clostridia bacterium]|nr:DUF2953 domain-containing protein [Clostridia bacterium]